jgi:hypothetical protein
VLDTARLRAEYGLQLPDWHGTLQATLDRMA